MAVESPPWATAVGTYSAEQTRRAMFAAFARTAANTPGILAGGLLSATDMQLSAPGSGLSVNISTGEAIIGGTEGGTQGGYYARNASTTNLAIATANASNPRIDTVCATVFDAGYTEPSGGSGSAWALQVVTGTATAGATLTNLTGAAAVPGSSLLLGYVLVPAAATSIITADIASVAAMAASALGNQLSARSYRASALTLPATTWTKIPMDGLSFDKSGGAMDHTSTYRYNCPVGGTYSVQAQVCITLASGETNAQIAIYKNGSLYSQGIGNPYFSANSNYAMTLGDLVPCNTGDYLEIWASESGSNALVNGPTTSFMSVAKAGN